MEGATPQGGISGEAAGALIGIDNSGDTSVEGRGQMRKDISNAMVGLKKQLYGKGPVKAKTFINDNFAQPDRVRPGPHVRDLRAGRGALEATHTG